MSSETVPFIAFRDRLLPRSETFIPRQYRGFERLQPIWLGSRLDDGAALIEGETRIIGEEGTLGGISQFLFKQFGIIPGSVRALGSRHPAVIHANFGRGGALCLPIAEALTLPMVVTFHGGDATKHKHYRPRGPFRTIYQRRLAELQRRTKTFVCVSDFIRRTLIERGFPPEKLVVNPYGIDLPPGAVEPMPTDRPYILFVGRLVEKKGLPTLFDAMAKLRQRHPGIDLVIVGEGPLRDSLQPMAEAAAARFIGWQTPAEVRRWMAGALAFTAPSVTAATGDSEGLPNTVLEAMSLGRAVVGSDHAGIGEAIVDGVSGLLCRERDSDAVAAALTKLVENPGLARTLGDGAAIRVRQEFDATRRSRKLETILLSAAGISG